MLVDCSPFTKHSERIQNLKKKNTHTHTHDLNYLYKNKLDKASFAHDAVFANC